MALGVRDLLMVIRAQNLASGELKTVTGSLGTMDAATASTVKKLYGVAAGMGALGAGIGAMGAAGLAFLNSATNAAVEYDRQSALTLTQVDQLGVSLDTIKKIGRDVAAAVPAPFDEMQKSLYDIFSSMDVNTSQAQSLLTAFSKAAVAGQVDVQDAARGTIGILNAYHMSADQVNMVNDVMFELVRKGVGTYGDFANSIGMATPAASRAGQSIQSLAGMMAFLTRNGLDASSAASSAMRALENIANPNVISRLKGMGVDVVDATGNFRPMVDIVTDLGKKLANLTAPEKAAALQDILMGAGNSAQARRFWNIAINQFQQLNDLTGDMVDSSGALQSAYNIMFDQPASKAQQLTNQYQIMKTMVGDILVPAKLKLVDVMIKLMSWWNNLSPAMQSVIVKAAAATAIFFSVAGVLLMVGGAIVGVVAMLVSLGMSIGGAVLLLAGFAAALVAIPIIIFLVMKYHKQLWDIAKQVWSDIKQWAGDLWHTMQDFWDWLSSAGVSVWHAIYDAAQKVWTDLKGAWHDVQDTFMAGFDWFNKNFGDGFKRIWNAAFGGVVGIVQALADAFVTEFGRIKGISQDLWNWFIIAKDLFANDFWPVIRDALGLMQQEFQLSWGIMKDVVSTALDLIHTAITVFVGLVESDWSNFGGTIFDVIRTTWDGMSKVIAAGITIITNVVELFINIFTGNWGKAWDNVKNIFGAAWDAMYGALTASLSLIKILVTQLPGDIIGWLGDVSKLLWGAGAAILSSLWNGIVSMYHDFTNFIGGIPDDIITFLGDVSKLLWDVGVQLLKGLIGGMESLAEEPGKILKNILGGVVNGAKSFLGISSPSKVFEGLGIDTMNGYIAGLQDRQQNVQGAMTSIIKTATSGASDLISGLKTFQSANDAQAAMITAKQNLAYLQSKPGSDPNDILQAQKALTAAQWDSLDAQNGLIDAAERFANAGGASQQLFVSMAQSAGFSADQISAMVTQMNDAANQYRDMTQLNGTGAFGSDPFGRLPGNNFYGQAPGSEFNNPQPMPMINIESATFGSTGVVDDLNWWAQTQTAGV